MAASPQSAQASLDAIQAALKAVGGTGTAPAPDDDTLSIERAMQALSKPATAVIPDKTAADFDSGGYGAPGDAARRGAGAAGGVVNTLMSLPGMIVGGLASGPAAALHHFFPDSMPTGQEALEEAEQPVFMPEGEYAHGADFTQGAAGKAFNAVASGGGSLATMMTNPRIQRPAGLLGLPGQQDMNLSLPPSPAQRGPKPIQRAIDAKYEAGPRSAGEAITNALMAVGLGGEGAEDMAARPGAKAEAPVSAVADVPRETKPPVEPEVPAASEFEARMQQAAPKPKAPEPVTPEVQEANVAGLEAPYRATPQDPVSMFPKLPKDLRGAKPRQGDTPLTFETDLDRAAYIVGNPRTTSARHADYLEWLAQALGTDENTALFLAKRSLAATKAAVKAGRGTDKEGFIPAYLRPGDPNFKPEPLTPPPSTGRGVRPPAGEPPDLLHDIAKAGGISKDHAVNVFGMDTDDVGVMRGGIHRVMHKNGLEPDAMAEKLNEMGWNFRDPNGNTNSYDLMDKFEQALHGKKFYSADHADDAAEAAYQQYEASQREQYKESGMQALDKALDGTRLTRTPIPPGASDQFTSMNSLRMGQGEGEPLPYTQYVRDVYPSPADEVISTIGERVIQQAQGDPTRVHLDPRDLQALTQALSARGWPKHRVDILEKLSAAVAYARENRQIRNEGYAPMRAAIQDHNMVPEVLKHPENFSITARLNEFKPPRDFEKVCIP